MKYVCMRYLRDGGGGQDGGLRGGIDGAVAAHLPRRRLRRCAYHLVQKGYCAIPANQQNANLLVLLRPRLFNYIEKYILKSNII